MPKEEPTVSRRFLQILSRVGSSYIVSLIGLLLALVIAGKIAGAEASAMAGLIFTIFIVAIAMFSLGTWRLQTGRFGPPSSQWQVSEAEYVWTIHDIEGRSATFFKRTRGRCLSDGVRFIQETGYGDSNQVALDSARHSGGKIIGVTGTRRHYAAIQLDHVYNQGDEFEFTYTRDIIDGFRQMYEWVSVTTDYYAVAGSFSMEVRFPAGTEIDIAWMEIYQDSKAIERGDADSRIGQRLGSSVLREGMNIRRQQIDPGSELAVTLQKTVESPLPGHEYLLRWKWNGGQSPEHKSGSEREAASSDETVESNVTEVQS